MAIAVTKSNFEGCVLPIHPLYAEVLDTREFEHADSPIVKAAYNIAAQIHGAQPRNPKQGMDAPIAYITHPIMVCKLLKLMQNALPEKYADRKALDDEMYLAVALLHDVLEEKGTRYYHQPNLLIADLCKGIISEVVKARIQAEMRNKGMSPDSVSDEEYQSACRNYPSKKYAEIQAIATMIVGDCKSLCNPEKKDMLEGKRAYQARHMQTLADRPKLVKMLDQMASCIEDILFESQRTPQQIHEFFHKALDVVKAGGASGLDEHKLAEQMFLKIFEHYDKIQETYGTDAQHHELRNHFSIHAVVANALQERVRALQEKANLYANYANKRQHGHVPYVTVSHPSFSPSPPRALLNNKAVADFGISLPDFGCVNVKLREKNGEVLVVGYSVRVPQDASSTLNLMLSRKAQTYLTGAFEKKESGKRVSVGDLRPHDGDFVSDYWLEQPMKVPEFMAFVSRAGEAMKADIRHMVENPDRAALSPEHVALLEDVSKKMNPLMDYAMQLELKKTALKLQCELDGSVGRART